MNRLRGILRCLFSKKVVVVSLKENESKTEVEYRFIVIGDLRINTLKSTFDDIIETSKAENQIERQIKEILN